MTEDQWALSGPLDSYKDAAKHLRRPFTAQAVKWKVQWQNDKTNPSMCGVIGYIDARLVIERFNLLIPHLWFAEYEILQGGKAWCRITIRDAGHEERHDLTRCDVGEGQGKALISDSLKRAAVHFGVAVSVYAVPQAVLSLRQHGTLLERQKDHLVLTPAGVASMRLRYEKWLEEVGEPAFGPPLDHGDQADNEAEAGEQAVQAAPSVQAGNMDARAAAIEAQDSAAEAPQTQAAPEATEPPPTALRDLERAVFDAWKAIDEPDASILKKIKDANANQRILEIQLEAAQRKLAARKA